VTEVDLVGLAAGGATTEARRLIELYGAADGLATVEARWVKDVGDVAAGGLGRASARIVAIRSLAGWSSGWALADLRVAAAKLVIVLAYGLPFEGTEIPQQSIPMCLRHEQEAIDKGVFVYSQPLTALLGQPCWICNPQATVWGANAPSAIP
jgi:hypothetical protein